MRIEAVASKVKRERKTSSVFGDLRLDKQFEKLSEAIVREQHTTIRRLSQTQASQMAFHRFIGNEAVSEAALINKVTRRCRGQDQAGECVLVMHDTTVIDYSLAGKALRSCTRLGPIGNGRGWGCWAHAGLALRARDASVLGIASLQLGSRKGKEGPKPGYATPLEAKESYRWIAGCRQAAETLPASSLIHVQDREGDMYDAFVLREKEEGHLLIRSRADRRIETEGGAQMLLSKYLSAQPSGGTYSFEIKGDCGKKARRQALMELRFAKVAILRKATRAYHWKYPEKEWVYVVEARELACSAPEGEEPVCWRLLTTLAVESWSDAAEKVYFYSLRWKVEDLFRLLKKDGFRVESSGLTTGAKLRKIIVLAMEAATRALQLRQARDGESTLPVQAVFEERERDCLRHLAVELEGATAKQKNPHPPESLAWASWVIARLGGWKGYQSQRKPGVITMKYGLERFQNIFIGWNLANGRDV